MRPHHNKIKIAMAKMPRPCLPLVGPRPGITAAGATHTTSKKTRRIILWNGLDRLATSDRQCFTTGDRSGLNRPPTVENWLIKHFGSSNLHHCMRCRSATQEQPASRPTTKPTRIDVIGGRGQGVQRLPGNRRYRKLVAMNKVR